MARRPCIQQWMRVRLRDRTRVDGVDSRVSQGAFRDLGRSLRSSQLRGMFLVLTPP